MSHGCVHTGSDLFVHRCEGRRQGPAVHALVVGTSNYQTNYEKTPPDRAPKNSGLRDIPGAALGAALFAEWLAERFNDPEDIPLLTVRLLLAPVERERQGLRERVAFLDATRSNVSDALEAWYTDCDSHPGNIAIMYVAGHGIVAPVAGQAVSAFLSGANFAQDRDAQTISMIRVDDAMRFCRARTNVFVYDCCATTGKDGVASEAGVGLRAQTGRGEQRKFLLTVAAARLGDSAYARGPNVGTLLSEALIPLLSTAGEIVRSKFAITRYRLGEELEEAIRKQLVNYKGRRREPQQEPRVRGDHPQGGLHLPKPPPEFEVKLVPSVSSSDEVIHYTIQEFGSRPFLEGQLTPETPTSVVLPAGEYLLESWTSIGQEPRKDKLVVDRDISFAMNGHGK